MNRKAWIGIVIALVALVVVAGLVYWPKPHADGVRIGVALPLTGDAAVYGKALKNGIELALEEHRQSGGFPVTLVYEDDQYSPKMAVSAIQKLIQVDKVPVIIGGAGSTTAEPVIPICDKNKVVLLSPCATAPSLSGASPYFFRLWPSDNYDGTVMADTAYGKLGIRKVAILYVNASYGLGITKVFSERFESLGGKVGITEAYAQGATDFRAQLTKIKSNGAEWVFVPGYVKELTNVLKQTVELGLKVKFLGVNSMHDPKLLEVAGKAAEGAVFSVPTYDAASDDPTIQRFAAAYKTKYGSEPDAFAATGYDAMRVIIEAIRSGGGHGSDDILKGMHSVKAFVGPSGTITFDDNGDVQKPLRLMTVRDGAFVRF